MAGCNDVRIAIKFRALKELVQLGGATLDSETDVVPKMPTIGMTTSTKLMCDSF